MKEDNIEMRIPLLVIGEEEEEGNMSEEEEPLTTNKIKDPDKERDGNDHTVINKLRWIVIYIMYFVMFVQIVSYASTYGSLWQYLQAMNGDVTETFLGWTITSRSLLSMIACFLFGIWCDRRPWLEPLFLSVVMRFGGNILYIAAESFGRAGIWVVFIAQLLLGFQGGVFTISRTLVTHYSYADEVSKTIAYLSLFETFGFMVGPAIQAIGLLFAGNSKVYANYHIDLYTAPSYFMILLGLVNCGLYLLLYYKDLGKRKLDPAEMNKSLGESTTSATSVDKLVVVSMLLIFFIIVAQFVSGDVLFSPVLMELIGWDKETSIKYASIIMASNAVLAIVIYFLISPLTKCISDRSLLLFGLASYIVVALLHYPFGPGKLELRLPDVRYPNGTIIHAQDGGCPYEYEWCHNTPRLPLPQLIVCTMGVAISNPISLTLVSTIYAKIVGSYRRGFYMGVFAGIGALSRAVSPFYISYVYKYFGVRASVYLSGGLALVAIIMLLIIWKRIAKYQ